LRRPYTNSWPSQLNRAMSSSVRPITMLDAHSPRLEMGEGTSVRSLIGEGELLDPNRVHDNLPYLNG